MQNQTIPELNYYIKDVGGLMKMKKEREYWLHATPTSKRYTVTGR
jgi:hypothetical protein